MSRTDLDAAKEQLIYLLLPRLNHEEWCRDWEGCCTAKSNARIFVELMAALPGQGDEVVDAINAYEVEAGMAEAFGDFDLEVLEGPTDE